MSTQSKDGSVKTAVVAGVFAIIVALIGLGGTLIPKMMDRPSNPTVFFTPTPAPSPPPPKAQEINISGNWSGELTQIAQGGSRVQYNYEMRITQNRSFVQGRTRINIANTQSYADLEIDGTISGDQLSFQDLVLDQSYPVGMVWCQKNGNLRYTSSNGTTYLEGSWTAPGCSGGQIILQKQP